MQSLWLNCIPLESYNSEINESLHWKLPAKEGLNNFSLYHILWRSKVMPFRLLYTFRTSICFRKLQVVWMPSTVSGHFMVVRTSKSDQGWGS